MHRDIFLRILGCSTSCGLLLVVQCTTACIAAFLCKPAPRASSIMAAVGSCKTEGNDKVLVCCLGIDIFDTRCTQNGFCELGTYKGIGGNSALARVLWVRRHLWLSLSCSAISCVLVYIYNLDGHLGAVQRVFALHKHTVSCPLH